MRKLPGVVLEGLIELSDRVQQEQLWLHGDGGMSSFTEAICAVFDDGCVSRLLEEGEIDEPLRSLFEELDGLISAVPEDADPRQVITHPSMESIRDVARRILDVLREMKSHEDPDS